MAETREPPPRTTYPSVSVILPVYNEAAVISGCLEAVEAQTYGHITEVVVADGDSSDDTREIATGFPAVKVVDNPRRNRPAGLNAAIAAASGDVIVRVDARTRLASDYVERCVDALAVSGAAIVGGPMRFRTSSAPERAIATAMSSPFGAGPAEFRRAGGLPRFVDTVYLGAFRAEVIRRLGGYDEWSGGNEDAELAFRAQSDGGVYLDPAIVSEYLVRQGLGPLGRQFYRYGTNRARTIRKHPASLSARQLAVPALALGLLSPWRRYVLASYVTAMAIAIAAQAADDPAQLPVLICAFPVMHGAWGAGFVKGISGLPDRR